MSRYGVLLKTTAYGANKGDILWRKCSIYYKDDVVWSENLIRVTQYGANFNKGDVIWGQLSEKYCYSIAIALYYL